MSSINTNAGAMTALQTLKATNKNLETTQGRISTGARVNEAAHNAAYWSIATTMRSDNNAMSTVKDALGLGAAQVDIAYTAMDAVKDTLDQMKSKLVAASQPDIDKAKIQEEIRQLQNDLKTYAKSATFSGGNWLDVDKNSVQRVVASFIRDADNNISLETIDVNTAKFALFTNDAAQKGLLQKYDVSVTPGAETIDLSALSTPAGVVGDDTNKATAIVADFKDVSWKTGDTFTFNLRLDGNSAVTEITVKASEDGFAVADFNNALNAVFGTGTIAASFAGDDLVLAGPVTSGYTLEVSNLKAATAGNASEQVTVTNFNITQLNRDDIQKLISNVDKVLGEVTTAASDLGAIKTRIASQQDFVGKIMDAVNRGVGQLVDADMEEESTRLQALQVQQQLGIQALSIANSNTQNILSLFR